MTRHEANLVGDSDVSRSGATFLATDRHAIEQAAQVVYRRTQELEEAGHSDDEATLMLIDEGTSLVQSIFNILRSEGLTARVICIATMRIPVEPASNSVTLSACALHRWGHATRQGGKSLK